MHQEVSAPTLKSWLHDGGEIALLDVREHGQYGESHLFHAVPLPFSRLELDVARLVPRRTVRCVVYDGGDAATGGVAQRAAQRLAALGYSNVSVLHGGTQAWKGAGHALFAGVHVPCKSFGEMAEHAYHTPSISADDLAGLLERRERVVVIDGRPVAEFRKMNIPTAICCPNGELALRVRSLVPDDETPIVVNCAGRTRSIIGAQTLLNLGIPNPVYALENGTQGWYLQDHQLEHGSSRSYAADSASNALLDGAVRLAERFGVPQIDATTAAAWAADPQRTLYLCDVRTPEEFAQGSLPGARHTPGGQLIQAFDQYAGVRGARLLLVDSDGIRARTVASWLRQMGHDASVLEGGLHSGFAMPAPEAPAAPALQAIEANAAAAQLDARRAVVLDLRASSDFRKAHIPGARWTLRPLLRRALAGIDGPVILVADEPDAAAWAVESEWPQERERPQLLRGGMAAWRAQGLREEATPNTPTDAECIDFLFFVHDRHDGNKEAARRYIAWETGLVGQMDEQERSAFRLPGTVRASGAFQTRLVALGRTTAYPGGRAVNPPLVRASTVLFSDTREQAEMRERRSSERIFSYGARGTPTVFALEDAVSELEGAYRSRLFPSGLAAIGMALLAYLKPGDGVLMSDSVYEPARLLAESFLKPYNIDCTFFAADGSDIESRFKPNTRLVYAECPGSLVYEMCDLPRLARLAHERGALLAADNTWGSGVLYRPLALGADISIIAATKYLSGHSDVVMGTVATTREAWEPLSQRGDAFGMTVSPDDAWLVLRGMRTLAARLQMHERHALQVARWLAGRPEVARIFCPALPGDPGHALWQRDCNGTNGLLSFEWRAGTSQADADRFIDSLRLFGIGASWGGYESLVTAANMRRTRSVADWSGRGPVVRLHIGLEEPEELIADLAAAFEAAAAGPRR